MAGTELGLALRADSYAATASSGLLRTSARLPTGERWAISGSLSKKPTIKQSPVRLRARGPTNLHPNRFGQSHNLSRWCAITARLADGTSDLGRRRWGGLRATMLHLHHGRRGMMIRHSGKFMVSRQGQRGKKCLPRPERHQSRERSLSNNKTRLNGPYVSTR